LISSLRMLIGMYYSEQFKCLPPNRNPRASSDNRHRRIVDFGGQFGSAPVMEVRNSGASAAFVRFGGRIPAPMQSLRN
jgi:hypothetical protein